MKKNLLRKLISKKLNSISREERSIIEKKIQNNLFKSKVWNQADSVGITMSSSSEWDTKEIIKRAWKENKYVYIPKITTQMAFQQLKNFDELHKGKYDLLEIRHERRKVDKSKIDLLIVPGIAFNLEGYRLGFGKGYYDRYLNDFNKQSVSLLFEEIQLLKELPVENHDLPVDLIITDQGEINCLQVRKEK